MFSNCAPYISTSRTVGNLYRHYQLRLKLGDKVLLPPVSHCHTMLKHPGTVDRIAPTHPQVPQVYPSVVPASPCFCLPWIGVWVAHRNWELRVSSWNSQTASSWDLSSWRACLCNSRSQIQKKNPNLSQICRQNWKMRHQRNLKDQDIKDSRGSRQVTSNKETFGLEDQMQQQVTKNISSEQMNEWKKCQNPKFQYQKSKTQTQTQTPTHLVRKTKSPLFLALSTSHSLSSSCCPSLPLFCSWTFSMAFLERVRGGVEKTSSFFPLREATCS